MDNMEYGLKRKIEKIYKLCCRIEDACIEASYCFGKEKKKTTTKKQKSKNTKKNKKK